MNAKLLAALVTAALTISVAAFAQKKVAPINLSGKDVAVKGYDVVAYFNNGAATKGSNAHSADWMGATWRFASAANKQTFESDPAKYAPAYGGYCAWPSARVARLTSTPMPGPFGTANSISTTTGASRKSG